MPYENYKVFIKKIKLTENNFKDEECEFSNEILFFLDYFALFL